MKLHTEKTAFFGALCFFFSAIELVFPKPLPFLRLGLANLPLLIGLRVFTLREYVLLVIIKVFGGAIISGTLFSYVFLFSLIGSFSSALVMYLFHRFFSKKMGLVGISLMGSFCSNTMQLMLGRLLIFGESLWLIVPPFLIAGTATAFFLGLFAEYFACNSKWFTMIKENKTLQMNISVSQKDSITVTKNYDENVRKETKKAQKFFIAGMILLPILVFSQSIKCLIIVDCMLILLNYISKRKIRFIPLVIMSITIVFFNLLSPAGEVIFSVWSLRVTDIALMGGIKKALILGGMILLSRWMIRPNLALPGKLGAILLQAFLILEKLLMQKKKFNRKKIIESLDSILETVSKNAI